MITFRDLLTTLRELDLDRSRPVIAHVSLSSFGEVQGGAPTILGALLAIADSVMMPTFTYSTMVTPEVGPAENAIEYGRQQDANRMASIFDPDMPADRLMGTVAETLRCHPKAQRSLHPILSFAGIGVAEALDAQSYSEPLASIGVLMDAQGWVLLMGVAHTVNTSIHYAERLAGRKQFVRWALTQHGARECPGFPGCSDGFQAIEPRLKDVTRSVQIGMAKVQAIPLLDLVERTRAWITDDPLALLCEKDHCERCNAVRQAVSEELEM